MSDSKEMTVTIDDFVEAAKLKNYNFIKYGLTKVNVNKCDQKGWTALHGACLVKDNEEVVLALLKAGADVHATTQDRNSLTPLLIAVRNNAGLPVVKKLISMGASVLATDKHHRQTVLHPICKGYNKDEYWTKGVPERIEMADYLLKHGAGPCLAIQDHRGRTPFDMAMEWLRHSEMPAFLKEWEEKVGVENGIRVPAPGSGVKGAPERGSLAALNRGSPRGSLAPVSPRGSSPPQSSPAAITPPRSSPVAVAEAPAPMALETKFTTISDSSGGNQHVAIVLTDNGQVSALQKRLQDEFQARNDAELRAQAIQIQLTNTIASKNELFETHKLDVQKVEALLEQEKQAHELTKSLLTLTEASVATLNKRIQALERKLSTHLDLFEGVDDTHKEVDFSVLDDFDHVPDVEVDIRSPTSKAKVDAAGAATSPRSGTNSGTNSGRTSGEQRGSLIQPRGSLTQPRGSVKAHSRSLATDISALTAMSATSPINKRV